MRKKDLSVAFEGVAEAAQEQAGLSEVPEEKPAAPPTAPAKRRTTADEPTEPARTAAPEDSATARFEARLAGGSQQTWKKMDVHGVTIRISQQDINGIAQTTVRMDKPLREAVRVVTNELGCTFEEFVRDALGLALERFSGVAER